MSLRCGIVVDKAVSALALELDRDVNGETIGLAATGLSAAVAVLLTVSFVYPRAAREDERCATCCAKGVRRSAGAGGRAGGLGGGGSSGARSILYLWMVRAREWFWGAEGGAGGGGRRRRAERGCVACRCTC
jgi:hypothetical protein